MVFDAVAVNGTTVRDHPLIQRLQAIGRHVIAPASKLSATSTPVGSRGSNCYPTPESSLVVLSVGVFMAAMCQQLHLVGKEFFPVTRVRKVFDRITARRRGDHTTFVQLCVRALRCLCVCVCARCDVRTRCRCRVAKVVPFSRCVVGWWSGAGFRYLYRGAHGSNLNDGVVFTPGDKGYFQPRGTLLKWKWFEDNTIDFFVDIDALESKKFGALALLRASRHLEHLA